MSVKFGCAQESWSMWNARDFMQKEANYNEPSWYDLGLQQPKYPVYIKKKSQKMGLE